MSVVRMFIELEGKSFEGVLYSCEKDVTSIRIQDGLVLKSTPIDGEYILNVKRNVLVPNVRYIEFDTTKLYTMNPEACAGSISFIDYVNLCKNFNMPKVESYNEAPKSYPKNVTELAF